ncbi:MAG: hypothetical protein IPO81_20795 [Kouleothrix sp.]|nr:hypothetical protein [Kouleothrix sp.]
MPRSSTRRPRHSAIGLDEIAPNRFLVHDSRVPPLLKDEGVMTGRLFELTTWRRDGLLARLRERDISVRTIADRVDRLPGPRQPPPIGGVGWRPLAVAIEQFSHFDLRRLRWHLLAPETRDGVAGVTLYDGWVLRRRKGRGSTSFYLAFKERGGGIGLRALQETEAFLTGYAQALELDPRPWVVERRGDDLLLPDVELPPPYREVLLLLARPSAEGPLVDTRGWPLAQRLFDRLGVLLKVEDH